MTLTVEDDFREFVAARWPELEAVAFLVALDADVARGVTTDALAALHHAWRESVDEGRPGEQARRAVLREAVAGTATAAGRRRRHGGPAEAAAAVDPVPSRGPSSPSSDAGPAGLAATGLPWEQPESDAVLEALADVLRAATPVRRAVVAGHAVWAAEPEEVAGLLGMPVEGVRAEAAAVRGNLSDAHDRARASQGLGPAPWSLDRDLEDAVASLLHDQGDPPDPAALVAERSRRVRRRTVVASGLGVAGVALGAWVVGSSVTSGSGASTPAPSAWGTPPPGDPSWASTRTWAPRGALGNDAGIQALVIARAMPGSRLLWADEVGDRRIAIAALPESPDSTDSIDTTTTVAVWTGPRGAEPARLEELPLTVRDFPRAGAAVAVVVPDGTGATGLLVLLAPPRVLRCSHSDTVLYTPAGGVRRRWTEVGLADGVGASLVPGPIGPAMRVRLGGFDGAPAGPQRVTLGYGSGGEVGSSLMAAAAPFAMAATGPPRPGFLSELVFEGPAPGDLIDPTAVVAQPREGRVAVVHTTTPEGAVLRSVRVRDDGRSRAAYLDLETVRPIAAEDAKRPFAVPLPAVREEVGRFLVVAPGATQAQLLAITPNAYPVSKVGDLRHGTGVLEVVNARQAAVFRLVLWDARGRRLGSWRQLFGRRDPNDLWPRSTI